MKWYLHWEVQGVSTFYTNSDREEFDTEELARKRLDEVKNWYDIKDKYYFYYSLIHGTRVEYK